MPKKIKHCSNFDFRHLSSLVKNYIIKKTKKKTQNKTNTDLRNYSSVVYKYIRYDSPPLALLEFLAGGNQIHEK